MSLATPNNIWEYYNRDAIKEYPRTGYLGIKVDTKKATWHGEPYRQLDWFKRRKWENFLVLMYAKTRIRISYH